MDAQTAARVQRVQQLLDQYGNWIDKYRGGVPRSFAATIMMWESNGDFNAPGDPSLGEIGFYQVASYVPQMFGYSTDATADPESNVCIGLLEYQYEAVGWNLFTGGKVPLGSADSYKLARMTFAIGRAGAQSLAASAQAAGISDSDGVYAQIAKLVTSSGAPSLGGVSAQKVAQRVLDIDTQWQIADLASDNTPGLPTLVPDPPAGPYTIPADAAPYFVKPLSTNILIVLGGLGVLAYALHRRRKQRG